MSQDLSAGARDHLWMHFTRLSAYSGPGAGEVPVIVRGSGPYIWDQHGKRYLDGLSGLFVVQAGHGRTELAEAAAKQAGELAFFPLWSYAHPKAVELVCTDDEHLLDTLNTKIRKVEGVSATETFMYLKLAKQTYAWGTR